MLLLGTRLAHGRRQVSTALRLTGHAADPAFATYHAVLNRARWAPLALVGRLLLVLLAHFSPADAPVLFVFDEHLERRWGRCITKRGHYCDPARSSKGHAVSSSGLRWLVCALVMALPSKPYEVALPVLAVLRTPPAVAAGADAGGGGG